MTAEQHTSAQRSLRNASTTPAIASPTTDWTASPLVTALRKRLSGNAPRYVTRAPGRLDVMGGIGEYTGSLVLNTTLADHVCAAVQTRTDRTLSIRFLRPSGRDDGAPVTFPLAQLVGADGAPVAAEQGRGLTEGSWADRTRCVVGVLVEMVRARVVPELQGGLSVVIGSTLDGVTDAGGDAALAAAVLTAAVEALDVKVEALSAADVCNRVQNDWLKLPIGPADAVGVLLGEPHTVTQLHCDPCTPADPLHLPDDLALIGIDCGFRHPDALKRYERVRSAAFMGRALIDRIIRHEGTDDLRWNGYLSRISATDYVGSFRDRIPTRLRGRDFLDRFGETGDPLTRIEPDFVYKIRSRSEHHIYEHARVCQFAACLSRAIRNSDEKAFADAGEPMYASHWSYGQRCGLGSAETDLLVTLLRRHGLDAGIFGAKITGRGCGGVVAVLMRATDEARAAVEASIADYQERAEHTTRIVRGSLPGAMVTGARRL